MDKKTHKLIKPIVIFICVIVVLISTIGFLVFGLSTVRNKQASNLDPQVYDRLYHIVVTGTYESSPFLQRVYEGAMGASGRYNAIVELHLPSSQAEDFSLQEAIHYSSYVNADGVITLIESPDTSLVQLPRSDETSIPLVTTGQFAANLNQISYIGINYWELGKKIGEEADFYLPEEGTIFILNTNSTLGISNTNIFTSLNKTLSEHGNNEATIRFINSIDGSINLNQKDNLIVCLSEEDTIYAAQALSELYTKKNYLLLGYGNNETCQLYFDKGLIDDLLTLDPVKIGETAMKELFEFRNNGYANSYITADLIALRSQK